MASYVFETTWDDPYIVYDSLHYHRGRDYYFSARNRYGNYNPDNYNKLKPAEWREFERYTGWRTENYSIWKLAEAAYWFRFDNYMPLYGHWTMI